MYIIDIYTDDLQYRGKELINNEFTEAQAFKDIFYSHSYYVGYVVEEGTEYEETDKIKEESKCE